MREHTTEKSHFDEYVGHYFEKQSHFTNHPWTFRRSGRDILSKIKEASDKTLGDIANIGCDFMSNADPVFVQFITESFIRRNKLERDILIPCLRGANVRNWTVDWHGNRKGNKTYVIVFHDEDGNRLDNPRDFPISLKFLGCYKDLLESRRVHSQNVIKLGIKWYELAQSTFQMHTPKITAAGVATHAHFFLDIGGKYIFKHSCQVIYLKNRDLEYYKLLLGILNSSITNFFVKEVAGRIQRGYYEWAKKYIGKLPVVFPEYSCRAMLLKLIDEMLSLADRAMELSMYNLVRQEEYKNVAELLERRQAYIDEYRSVQARMKDIQNEIDHLVYKTYGITDPEDIAELEQPLYKRPWKEPDWDKEKGHERLFEFEARDYVNDLIEEIFAKQQFPNELPISSQDVGSELAANPKAEALRGAYYHGGPQPMAVFAKECMDTDCRTIPFDEEAAKVGRGSKKVDILHERFFRFDELDKELYGWTGWSPEGQLNVFLQLAQRARSEGKEPEPFKKWVESRVLRNIEDERTKEQTRAYLGRL